MGETFDDMLRVGLTAAGRVAEVIARAREQAAQEARAASEQQARELAARLAAERSAARAQLAPVQRSEWWDRAQPQDVAQAWETARAWERIDPDAHRAAERIRQEVHERYGVGVDAPGADPAAVREALARRGIAEGEVGTQRRQVGREESEAARLLVDADRADSAEGAGEQERAGSLQPAGDAAYDTAERRRGLSASLKGVAQAEVVQARVLADTFQARPPCDAVAQAPAEAPRARKGSRSGAARARQRSETLGP
ncbi:hypothetical protein D5H78_18670 [Vallicoccus soli]|uniref:Colicin import membrane protein n=2 Tax=Vallicoccus soli TaxID=2339232 RepID=A0A3A3ZBQ1_9ACTN|nr:hypothetical protein D5H78_18670 [Vallicoccus soli]